MEPQWPLILFATLLAWSAGLFGSQCLWALRGRGAKAQAPAWLPRWCCWSWAVWRCSSIWSTGSASSTAPAAPPRKASPRARFASPNPLQRRIASDGRLSCRGARAETEALFRGVASVRGHQKALGRGGSRSPYPLQRESSPTGAFPGRAGGRRYRGGLPGRPVGGVGRRPRRANECRGRQVTARAAAPSAPSAEGRAGRPVA